MYKISSAVVSVCMLAGVTLPAYAQPIGECTCLIPASQATGQIDTATGQVLVSGQDGFVPGQAGTPVGMGSRIITGNASEALITLGDDCRLRIGASLDMTVIPQAEQACVRVTRAQPNTAPQNANNTSNGETIPYVVVGGIVAIGVGIGLLAISK